MSSIHKIALNWLKRKSVDTINYSNGIRCLVIESYPMCLEGWMVGLHFRKRTPHISNLNIYDNGRYILVLYYW